ncbi:MAG: hypothetical protein HY234_02935 [Acidobacteria bacterium]|nr:hypothetical protein [Acidobacteriota bacterium]
MNAKFLVIGTLAGGILLFAWGAVTHMLLPEQVRAFSNDAALVQAVRANAPVNGVYFAGQGVFVAVSFLPDMADKTKDLAPMLKTQFLTDLLAALLLCFVLPGIRSATVLGKTAWLGLASLAAVAVKILPYSTWYGFSAPFVGMEVLDISGKFILLGFVLGGLMKKLVPAN